jgi:hypothetical protein
VLDKQLRDKWRARERAVPVHPVLTFTTEGLVLGAGTVLLKAFGSRQLQDVREHEAWVLALLAAAYGKAVPAAVLGNIERAAESWRNGDECLAHIHLAHSGLLPPRDVRTLACRLFVAENAMRAGVSPRAVLQACTSSVGKAYNAAEPRVPAGSGGASGEWTDSEEAGENAASRAQTAREEAPRLSLLETTPPASTSFLGTLDAAQLIKLGLYIGRFATVAGGAAAAFSLLFIPSPNDVRVEGEVSGVPGLKYWQNGDEAILHLSYDTPDGGRQTFAAYFDGDELRDEHGKVIGRVLPDGGVLIQSALVSPALVKDDEPRLCPAPGPDKKGERGRAYENYVKSFVNPPPNTTLPGIGFQLPNPQDSGALVYYDDCRRTTGMMADAKGPVYAKLLTFDQPMASVIMEWWYRAGRQIAASDGRPVRWYFAELDAALAARELFDSDNREGRARIEVVFLPWSKEKR